MRAAPYPSIITSLLKRKVYTMPKDNGGRVHSFPEHHLLSKQATKTKGLQIVGTALRCWCVDVRTCYQTVWNVAPPLGGVPLLRTALPNTTRAGEVFDIDRQTRGLLDASRGGGGGGGFTVLIASACVDVCPSVSFSCLTPRLSCVSLASFGAFLVSSLVCVFPPRPLVCPDCVRRANTENAVCAHFQ